MNAPTYGQIRRLVVTDVDYSPNAVGVRATTVIHIPVGEGWIAQTITSPGLWGIEVGDPMTSEDESYLSEVYEDEERTLRVMLDALGVVNDRPAFGSDPSGYTRV